MDRPKMAHGGSKKMVGMGKRKEGGEDAQASPPAPTCVLL